jgi:hypothetical protein
MMMMMMMLMMTMMMMMMMMMTMMMMMMMMIISPFDQLGLWAPPFRGVRRVHINHVCANICF